MPYTAHKPGRNPSSAELRARILGWGADLDRADRPAVPQALPEPVQTGAHWDLPERQAELEPRERSIEHAMLTPVFGTSVPLRGVSGVIRRLAYARYSEGRAAHWLLLLGADRVDTFGSRIRSLATLRPDNVVTETGIISEVTHHGIASRLGKNRADTKHFWIDPLIIVGPALVTSMVILRLARRR